MKEARDTGGCENGKSFEEELYWKHIKRIRFCTVFRPDSQDKLQIPKKFADNIKSNILHQKMTLKGPSGATWEVNLIRCGNDLFLQDGWQQFANAYSLQENDILIFKYDRNSSFNIKIFNGECEKVAAYFVKKCGHVYPEVENQKKRGLSETTENEICIATKKSCKNSGTEPVNHGIRVCVTRSKKILSNRKRIRSAINLVRKKAASRGKPGETEHAKQNEHNSLTSNEVSNQSGTKRGENELAEQPEKYILIKQELTETFSPDIEKVASSPDTRGRPRKSLCAPADIEYISNRRPITVEEKKNTMRKAASELTVNSFFTALPISSCYKHFFLTIPARFAVAHLGLRNQDVFLCIGKKKWKTEFSFSRGGLGKGWKEFALNNNLEESDVFFFKLISQESGEPVKLDVTIFRVVDEVTPLTLSILQ